MHDPAAVRGRFGLKLDAYIGLLTQPFDQDLKGDTQRPNAPTGQPRGATLRVERAGADALTAPLRPARPSARSSYQSSGSAPVLGSDT